MATIQSALLASRLAIGLLDDLLGLGREADQQARALLAGAELGEDVAGRHEISCGGPSPFLSLLGAGSTRQSATAATRIAASAGSAANDRIGHLLRGLDIDAVDARRRVERDRPGDQRNPRARFARPPRRSRSPAGPRSGWR